MFNVLVGVRIRSSEFSEGDCRGVSNCVDAVEFVEELLDLPEVPQGPGLLRNTR